MGEGWLVLSLVLFYFLDHLNATLNLFLGNPKL
jgi:hypothetical protein